MLLIVFSFNVGGYYIVFWLLQYQAANRESSIRFEQDGYSKDEMVVLKIPASLPYFINNEYQPITGSIEHGGEFYTLVKQKLENDTLTIVCLRDDNAKQLTKKIIDYTNVSNDTSSQSEQTQHLLNKLVKEYTTFYQIEMTGGKGWIMPLSFFPRFLSLEDPEQSVQSPPPKS